MRLPDKEISYWKAGHHTVSYPKLSHDLDVDAVIVGGGITGLTTAYLLKQAGLKVAVLEKRSVGAGTTGRATGKVSAQHNLIYADLYQRLGKKSAKIYGQANQAAISQIENIIIKEKISCNWQRADHYVYTDDAGQLSRFKQEYEAARLLGLPATFEQNTPLPFSTKAAVKFTGQANFHSIMYIKGLALAVHGHGSYVFEDSEAVGFKYGDRCLVKTKQGNVSAKYIVVATNVPTMPLIARGGYCVLEYPTESYIVAGKPAVSLEGMYISPDKHNYSLLPVKRNGEDFLLIGGESHISGVRLNKEEKYRKLANYAYEHFGVEKIEYKWSDRDYMSYDSIPLVGNLYPWSKNIYVATAFMKWGLTNGTVAAMILKDLICGNKNEWAETFNSNRLSPIGSIPRVAAKYLIPGFN